MRKLEKVLTILMLTGAVMIYVDVPGGSILLTFPCLILSFLYFPIGFALFNGIRLRHIFKRSSYENKTAIDITEAAFAGLFLQVGLYAVLFVIYQWEGTRVMITGGLTLSIICLLYSVIKWRLKRKKLYREILIRSIVISIAILLGIILYKDIPYVERQERYIRELEHANG